MNNDLINRYRDGKITIFDLVANYDKCTSVNNKEEGVVYTPKYIADYIVELVNPDKNETILEPSVGHGVFLFSLIEFMVRKYKMDIQEVKVWFEKYVIAVDFNQDTVEELKFIIRLYFSKQGVFNIDLKNIFVADALFHKFNNIDVVIGNPPYIRSRYIDGVYLKKLKNNFTSCELGNIDIYYAFMERFSELSKRFSFIVPNSYMSNNSAKNLRNVIKDKVNKIIDFKDELIFKNARTYTSIFLITNEKSDYVYYSNSLKEKPSKFNKSGWSDNGWFFSQGLSSEKLTKDELSDISITGSIATLRDNIFIMKNPIVEGGFYKIERNGKEYFIEQAICVDLLKITKPDEVNYIIYPYQGGKVIDENYFKNNYPSAYAYLMDMRSELDKRDKGKVDKYEAWYAYGRKQSLNIKSNSYYLFVPKMSNQGLDLELKEISNKFLIVSGYVIQSDNKELMIKIKEKLNSELFFDYLKSNGKVWAGKPPYYSLTLNQLKFFL